MTQPKLDRFDLSKMVSSQISQSFPVKRQKSYSKKNDWTTNDDWQNRVLPTSVKTILKAAHRGIKPIPLQAIQPVEQFQPKSTESKTKKKKKITNSKRKCIPFSYLGIPRSYPRYNVNSIPQIKASSETKAKQRARRPSTLQAQERAREIIRQKDMLHDMLSEHQKLQKDRATVALEIQSMKVYLGQIKKRLDTSLRKLNVSVDMPLEHPKKKKRKNF